MDKKAIDDAVKDMNCALKLDRKIVGVKFLFDEEGFAKADAKRLTGKMAYCVMVRTAMTGKRLKATVKNFGCMGGARALGMVELDEMSLSGRYYQKLGLYRDLATSKDVHRKMTFCRHRPYGVMVKPVEEYDEEPDVVLIATNPYNGMRIVQGYTHMFGFNTSLKMAGNQAICSECTAFPFESNDINVSLMCAGTRFKAKWDDGELAIGFPFNRFLSIVRGVHATLNLTEPNEKKTEIEARCHALNRKATIIEYNKNYWS
ncbi:MAG: hypothetical protein A4E64_00048 [Syntrophorhabdus sp. PtaU1.Bin058]|nr:MAG: hypothetical protein A4E64_00048 [Syntrophorhabdus sp. PtaU1.Bin058]